MNLGKWKTTTGPVLMLEVTVEPQLVVQVKEMQAMFVRFDICMVDAIVQESKGTEHIIEPNETFSNLRPDRAKEGYYSQFERL